MCSSVNYPLLRKGPEGTALEVNSQNRRGKSKTEIEGLEPI
jgi:hypothetical protein